MSTLPSPSPSEKALPSRRSERGLDGFAFFLADMQTGWGLFVAAYLTSKSWTQFDIGLILAIGTLSAMVLQIPIGALVDRVPGKRLLAALTVIAISTSALLLAFWPVFSIAVVAKLLHAVASCLAGPVLAAISLGLVGHTLFSRRLGRNARFLSLGNAIAAGLMGVVAHYYSNQSIFLFTAALSVPTLVVLAQIRAAEIDPALARGGLHDREAVAWPEVFRRLARMPALLIFAAAVVLFQLANTAMLPLLAGALTVRAPGRATLIVALCILMPQFVVAAIAAKGRARGAKAGPPSLPDALLSAAVCARRCVRRLQRPPRSGGGATARWHFRGDAGRAGATGHC